jgi:hypothetical protein
MVEDVMLAVNGKIPVFYYGRMGGIVLIRKRFLRI